MSTPRIKNLAVIIAAAAAVLALIFVVIGLCVNKIESRNCACASSQFHRRTHWDFWAGCYIDSGSGRMVSLDAYRAFGSFR